MKRALPIFLIIISFTSSFSQVKDEGPTAAQVLRLARATYEQGRLHEVPSQLSDDVILKMTNKQDKVSAYILLCLSNIYLENSEGADANMLKILETDPYYEPNPQIDPAEFVALYKTFRTYPIFRVGAKLGVNATRPNVTESVNAVQAQSGGGYTPKIAFQFGASADMPLYFFSKRLTLHGDLAFQIKKFQIDLTVNRGTANGETVKNKFSGIESENWISLPVTIEYEVLKSKFHPYVALGASVDMLLGDATITSNRQRDQQASLEFKDFNPLREKMNISAIGAAGVKLPLSGGFLVVEVRYVYGISKITTKESAFANAQFSIDYGYADSIFKINSLAVTGSYIINIFNPKKLKRK